ncbi:MAG: 30S ribosomal protein S12 methylthiotransferase RimO [Syntrophomonadaceae bacterium]|nr:30S ribosomal protein S12 methylthiotransferase RimO [Syntrophomonadaceae bacterium]MDD3888308.1 30S ribosomal protein S12 methylthiotransferase RimO [Syntrophomonadaceae bacterium]MDD4548815.1 30S ribosomal protein S12 methylthiotransferase RimO [Syntrophomonadaceae bacterium]
MDIGFISLGCAKNLVDTEIMMAAVKASGHKIVNSLERAEAIIINTCGFINEAKEEAIDTIIETGKLKEEGNLSYLIATGCLVQRYGTEILDAMPELDGIIGISEFHRLNEVLAAVSSGERVARLGPVPEIFVEKGPRYLTTPPGLAYLKIAEGCDNRCSYCTIPFIRGNLRSRPLREIVDEATLLVKKGIKELVVIAQDTSAYGKDLYGTPQLADLLHQLGKIEQLEWIRVMYLHPAHIDDTLIETIAMEEKVVPYLDIPIQHAANRVLKKMNRRHSLDSLQATINKLRANIEGLVLRTTVMVGFPGETEDDFQQLYNFIKATDFDWLGAFTFIPEEGTAAISMADQVPDEVKEQRKDNILKLQNNITRQKNIARIGKQYKILVSSQISNNLYIGRGYFQAPEVDGVTLVKSNIRIAKGEFVDSVMKAVRNYDMIGEIANEYS